MKITIAIDGHSSCGKSTMAKALAQRLQYTYADCGALFRAVTLYALTHSLSPEQIDDHLPHIDLDAMLQGDIRSMRVSQAVSPIAARPAVRNLVTQRLQDMGQQGGIVMDGRDIGTAVFPNAQLKVFVTASAQVRAQRRWLELKAKGQEVPLAEVLANVEERDRIDTTREVSPLRQAPDALVLDNSHLTPEEQLQWLLDRVSVRTGE